MRSSFVCDIIALKNLNTRFEEVFRFLIFRYFLVAFNVKKYKYLFSGLNKLNILRTLFL